MERNTPNNILLRKIKLKMFMLSFKTVENKYKYNFFQKCLQHLKLLKINNLKNVIVFKNK